MRKLQDILLFEFFLYIITGWIIIGLWQRFVENFFYNGLGLDRELPYHNFIVMFVLTGSFIILVSFISSILDINATNSENKFNPNIIQQNTSTRTATLGKSSQGQNGKITQWPIHLYQTKTGGPLREVSREDTMELVHSRREHSDLSPNFNGDHRHSRKRRRERNLLEERLHLVAIQLSR